MLKRTILFIIILAPLLSFGQSSEVCIAKFSTDSLKVSIKDIIEDPTVRICNCFDCKIIAYDLTLNINGEIHSWRNLKDPNLSQDKIKLLLQVQDDKPKYNQLFIENVKYKIGKDTNVNRIGIYLWLSQHTDCTGKYDIKVEKYKKKWQVKYEYFLCDGNVFLVKKYNKRGTLIETRKENYKWKK